MRRYWHHVTSPEAWSQIQRDGYFRGPVYVGYKSLLLPVFVSPGEEYVLLKLDLRGIPLVKDELVSSGSYIAAEEIPATRVVQVEEGVGI